MLSVTMPRKPSEPPSERIAIRVPVADIERWKRAAKVNHDVSLSALIKRAVGHEADRILGPGKGLKGLR